MQSRTFVVLALLFAAGCSGTIGGGSTAPDAPSATFDPGPVYLRRLTRVEYMNSVNDLTGVDVSTAAQNLPVDGDYKAFDNQSLAATISTLHAEGYLAGANAAAEQVLSTPALKTKVLGCDPSGANRDTCMRSFITTFGRRAFRRPLTQEEIDKLFALQQAQSDAAVGAQLVLGAVLQSPKFLFRVEVGKEESGRPNLRRLTGFELATRLAYFLYSSTPDDALLDAAQNGDLDSVEGLTAVVQKRMNDEAMHQRFHHYVEQWFELRRLETVVREGNKYANFAMQKASMYGEAFKFIDDFLWQANANMLDVYTAPYGYADKNLAPLYGVQASGTDLVRIDWPADSKRGGFFSTAAAMTMTAPGNETSVIKRGRFIREMVFCQPLPSPPQAAFDQAAAQSSLSEGDAVQARADNSFCASCHSLMDPIGKGLDRYGMMGELRTTKSTGAAVYTEGKVTGVGAEVFADAPSLGALAKQDAQTTAPCMVQHLFRWALARQDNADGADDKYSLDKLNAAFETSGYHFGDLLVAMATSEAFRFRRAPTGQ